jgi:hypothetical protein
VPNGVRRVFRYFRQKKRKNDLTPSLSLLCEPDIELFLRWSRQDEGEFMVSTLEEIIDATLDPNGQLRLSHRPSLSPVPVSVTIRVAIAVGTRRGLADVIREIAAEQRARGFPGRPAAELRAEDDARLDEDDERDRELDGARGGP